MRRAIDAAIMCLRPIHIRLNDFSGADRTTIGGVDPDGQA